MKTSILFILVCIGVTVRAQDDFTKYFIPKTLRVDYILAGNADSTYVYPNQLKEEPYWGGSRINLVDSFGYGDYQVEVYDKKSDKLIYSRGFCTLFKEWQTTAEAKVMDRGFYQVSTIPFPKEPVLFKLLALHRDGSCKILFSQEIDPDNYFIIRESPTTCNSSKVIDSGDPSKCVDIAFIAEGYTSNEMEKFRNDVLRVSNYILEMIPYIEYKHQFNIWAVEAISQDSGPDIPGENFYSNTALNSSYYTFDLPRYLTTYDIKSMRDYAANVPYDQIYVLINSPRYGGGGIYNYYTACTSDHELTPEVLTHEFGHGFAGLGDEYYNSDVAYEEFYPKNQEPWEPNLTTLINFESKWQDLVDKDLAVPTPAIDKYRKTVGVYEGGGYESQGVYRPYIDCRMKSNEAREFCPVCQRAIRRMIEFHIK